MTVYRKIDDCWVEEPPLRGSWWVPLEMWIRRLASRPFTQHAKGNEQ